MALVSLITVHFFVAYCVCECVCVCLPIWYSVHLQILALNLLCSFFGRIPTLQELGFSSTETLYSNKGGWIGGETVALKRLVEYCHIRSKPPSDSYVSHNFCTLKLYVRKSEGNRELLTIIWMPLGFVADRIKETASLV